MKFCIFAQAFLPRIEISVNLLPKAKLQCLNKDQSRICPLSHTSVRGAYHSMKISCTIGNILFFLRKIPKNPSVWKRDTPFAFVLCRGAGIIYALLRSTGIKTIETNLIPKILYGCETWTNITKQQIDKLEKIQKDALQRIVTIHRTTSRFGLYLECGILPIENRIIIRKLMYLKKILNMSDRRLVKIVYNEHKRLGMTKCWCNEVWTIIKNLGITKSEHHICIMAKKEL